jgi:hypothetical protein
MRLQASFFWGQREEIRNCKLISVKLAVCNVYKTGYNFK